MIRYYVGRIDYEHKFANCPKCKSKMWSRDWQCHQCEYLIINECPDPFLNIPVTTSHILGEFVAIDSIFHKAIANHYSCTWADHLVFEELKRKMRKSCKSLEGDAVICCNFSSKSYEKETEIGGSMRGVRYEEMWGFGTVVRLI